MSRWNWFPLFIAHAPAGHAPLVAVSLLGRVALVGWGDGEAHCFHFDSVLAWIWCATGIGWSVGWLADGGGEGGLGANDGFFIVDAEAIRVGAVVVDAVVVAFLGAPGSHWVGFAVAGGVG